MVSVSDIADRPPRALADGEELSSGDKRVRWLDAPHLPHNWECGYMFETTTRTLLCGDLFTHGGAELPALTESEVLGPSEAMRGASMGGVAIEQARARSSNKLAPHRAAHAGAHARQLLSRRRRRTAAGPSADALGRVIRRRARRVLR